MSWPITWSFFFAQALGYINMNCENTGKQGMGKKKKNKKVWFLHVSFIYRVKATLSPHRWIKRTGFYGRAKSNPFPSSSNTLWTVLFSSYFLLSQLPLSLSYVHVLSVGLTVKLHNSRPDPFFHYKHTGRRDLQYTCDTCGWTPCAQGLFCFKRRHAYMCIILILGIVWV